MHQMGEAAANTGIVKIKIDLQGVQEGYLTRHLSTEQLFGSILYKIIHRWKLRKESFEEKTRFDKEIWLYGVYKGCDLQTN